MESAKTEEEIKGEGAGTSLGEGMGASLGEGAGASLRKGESREKTRKEGGSKRAIWLCLLYGMILAGTLWAEIVSFQVPLGNGEINAHRIFYFFTNDSNIFCALTALAALVAALEGISSKRGDFTLSPNLLRLRLAGCGGVTLTFWTVLLFLGPVFGYEAMYYREDIFLHLVGPVLEVVAFLVFERGYRYQKRDVLLSALPMLIYTLWYVYETILERNIAEFYGFTRYLPWQLAAFLMVLISLLMGLILAKAHNWLEGRETGEQEGRTMKGPKDGKK